jgi:uroporphyrinogen III methyltransferase/synthase
MTGTASAAKTVLLTRPVGQNQSLDRALTELGYRAIEFPALSISAASDPSGIDSALAQLESFALVVFVSPNAIDQALARLPGLWPTTLPIAVMGPGSRERLAGRGIAAPQYRVITPHEDGARFDSESLFAALEVDQLVGRRCLIVRGNGGRNWLFDALKGQGVEVDSVAAYQRSIGRPERAALDQVQRLIELGVKTPVLITSSEAIDSLNELFRVHFGATGSAWLQSQPIVVSHRRIAENATAAGFASVHHSAPGDDALVRALEYLP